jgi:glutamyl-tRNA reductase
MQTLSDIVVVGLNHETAPVEVRECIAFSSEESSRALDALFGLSSIEEVVLISTCNRVEVLAATRDSERAVTEIKTFIAEFKSEPTSRFEANLFLHRGDEAVRHLFRVASSLDSMMVGEPQILGQVKEAYQLATRRKTSGVILNRLLHRAFFVAKRIRTETGIGDHAVSISYAAVELGKKIFGELDGKKVLLIGAGEMAELAVEHLVRNRADRITVANRTFERAVAMAEQFHGHPIRFEEILEQLQSVDIIIASAGASEFIVRYPEVKGLLKRRKNRPLFFIDIAVPRNIDPSIHRLGNTYVYDIDDLKTVIEENIEDRRREAVKAQRIVDEAVFQFRKWRESLDAVPTIIALREKLEKTSRGELEKTLQGLQHLSSEDRQALERMVRAVTNKFMHDPTVFLKGEGCHGDRATYVDMVRKLFKLDEG